MNDNLKFVHQFLPASRPDNQTTLLLLHGTGGDEHYLVQIGKIISPNSSILSPRGNVLYDGLHRFTIRSSEGRYDQDDLIIRVNELVEFLNDASRKYEFSLRTISILGYSNGGSMGATLILKNPGMIKKAVLFHPGFPFMPEPLPDLSETRILITSGEIDDVVTPDASEKLAKLLKKCGADTEMFKHKGGHELVKEEIYKAKKFFEN